MSDENRRPLTSRNSAWAARLASWAVAREITPNQISQASMGFAALGFFLYAMSTQGSVVQFLALLLAGLLLAIGSLTPITTFIGVTLTLGPLFFATVLLRLLMGMHPYWNV